MMPVLHGAPAFEPHEAPGVQVPQKPFASHVWAAVHELPADLGAPSTQVWAPVPQVVTP